MPTCNQPRPLALTAALTLGLGLGVCALPGCSEDGLRDMNYGTDVGGSYQLPDGLLDRASTEPRDAATDAGANDASDASPGTDAATPALDVADDTGPEVLHDMGAEMAAEPTVDAVQAVEAG
jgi:hypothetical protein